MSEKYYDDKDFRGKHEDETYAGLFKKIGLQVSMRRIDSRGTRILRKNGTCFSRSQNVFAHSWGHPCQSILTMLNNFALFCEISSDPAMHSSTTGSLL